MVTGRRYSRPWPSPTDLRIYAGKRVLVTGHTGFKGAWLCEWLLGLGAERLRPGAARAEAVALLRARNWSAG